VIDKSLTNKRRSQMKSEERLRLLQRGLYRKAKQDKAFRFYVLYDKLSLDYILREAWKRVRENKGAAGYDRMSVEDIEKYGVDKYLAEIAEEIRNETYKASPVLRVYIPKRTLEKEWTQKSDRLGQRIKPDTNRMDKLLSHPKRKLPTGSETKATLVSMGITLQILSKEKSA